VSVPLTHGLVGGEDVRLFGVGVGATQASGEVFPDTCLAMLLEVRAVRKAKDNNASPLIVHCSAGVGRTGAYAALLLLPSQQVQVPALEHEVVGPFAFFLFPFSLFPFSCCL
jgi:hypothetical protein